MTDTRFSIDELLENNPFFTTEIDPEKYSDRRTKYVMGDIHDSFQKLLKIHRDDPQVHEEIFCNAMIEAMRVHADSLLPAEASHLLIQVGMLLGMVSQRIEEYQNREKNAAQWLPPYEPESCCVGSLLSGDTHYIHDLQVLLMNATSDFMVSWVKDGNKNPPSVEVLYQDLREVVVRYFNVEPAIPMQRAATFTIGYYIAQSEYIIEENLNKKKLEASATNFSDGEETLTDSDRNAQLLLKTQHPVELLFRQYPAANAMNETEANENIEATYGVDAGFPLVVNRIISNALADVLKKYETDINLDKKPRPPGYSEFHNSCAEAIRDTYSHMSVGESMFVHNMMGASILGVTMKVRQLIMGEAMRGFGMGGSSINF